MGLACELKRPADTVLSEFFRANRGLGSHDRPFVAETVFSVLRNKRLLETIVPLPDPRRLVIASLVKLQGLSISALKPLINRSDEEWLIFDEPITADAEERSDPVPQGEESAEKKDES